MIEVTPNIKIDESELQFEFVRASGPGGQNINKVASAVQLRFDIAHSPALPEDVRSRLAYLAGRRLTDEGILIIEAKRFRTQEQNRQDALDRFLTLIRRASQKPKLRKPTRPTAQSRQRRLEAKKRRGEVKRMRSRPLREE